MDMQSSVSPDDFMNFDVGPYGSSTPSSDAAGAQGHDSNVHGPEGGSSSSALHHHQKSYAQTNEPMRVDLDGGQHQHSQSPFKSSSVSDPSMDPTASMDDAFSALLSMHNVDVDLDSNVNDPSASSSTASLNNPPLRSLHTMSIPSSQQNVLNMTQQQYHQPLPPFSQLHHSIQQQSHSSSPNSGSGPSTPLIHNSEGHSVLNLEHQMRLTQLQQLQQLQNQLFQQQV